MFGFMRTRACQRHYCGVCKTIGAEYGQSPRMLLNHDTVLVAEIMSALDPAKSCHPAMTARKCWKLPKAGEAPLPFRYAAATTMLLASAKIRDHVADTGKAGWRLLERVFSGKSTRAAANLAEWGLPVEEITARLGSQSGLEARPESLMQLAGPTAFATAEVCGSAAVAIARPDAEAPLRAFGDAFGRLIYVLDAWHDYARDAASKQFNAIRALYGERESARGALDAAAEDVRRAIEGLPLPASSLVALQGRFAANLEISLKGEKAAAAAGAAGAAKKKVSSCLPDCVPDGCGDCCDTACCCCECDCCCNSCACDGCCCDGCDCGGCDCS